METHWKNKRGGWKKKPKDSENVSWLWEYSKSGDHKFVMSINHLHYCVIYCNTGIPQARVQVMWKHFHFYKHIMSFHTFMVCSMPFSVLHNIEHLVFISHVLLSKLYPCLIWSLSWIKSHSLYANYLSDNPSCIEQYSGGVHS